jgi:hypothetical protein
LTDAGADRTITRDEADPAQGGVAVEPAGSHAVKGLERPIEVYRLVP